MEKENCQHIFGRTRNCLVMHYNGECHCFNNKPKECLRCGEKEYEMNIKIIDDDDID